MGAGPEREGGGAGPEGKGGGRTRGEGCGGGTGWRRGCFPVPHSLFGGFCIVIPCLQYRTVSVQFMKAIKQQQDEAFHLCALHSMDLHQCVHTYVLYIFVLSQQAQFLLSAPSSPNHMTTALCHICWGVSREEKCCRNVCC